MTGFIQLNINDFLRALITRCIALIPCLVIILANDEETVLNIGLLLDIVMTFQLPLALIHLLRFSRKKDIMGEYLTNDCQIAIAFIISSFVVILNCYLLIPYFHNASKAVELFILIFLLCYVYYLGLLSFVELED